ncbi:MULTISPECIES: hypothetical protein [Streptomyces]|uniref:Uncharacterized protein n=1 Tax=Streptomyces ramulosus TaxID=47762 RepID=A0ABW1FS57_9ACTN
MNPEVDLKWARRISGSLGVVKTMPNVRHAIVPTQFSQASGQTLAWEFWFQQSPPQPGDWTRPAVELVPGFSQPDAQLWYVGEANVLHGNGQPSPVSWVVRVQALNGDAVFAASVISVSG